MLAPSGVLDTGRPFTAPAVIRPFMEINGYGRRPTNEGSSVESGALVNFGYLKFMLGD
jgi:hypothetical protein